MGVLGRYRVYRRWHRRFIRRCFVDKIPQRCRRGRGGVASVDGTGANLNLHTGSRYRSTCMDGDRRGVLTQRCPRMVADNGLDHRPRRRTRACCCTGRAGAADGRSKFRRPHHSTRGLWPAASFLPDSRRHSGRNLINWCALAGCKRRYPRCRFFCARPFRDCPGRLPGCSGPLDAVLLRSRDAG